MAPFYRGGYSLLIAPLINDQLRPERGLRPRRSSLNAALAASIFPLLYLLLRRYLVDSSRAGDLGGAGRSRLPGGDGPLAGRDVRERPLPARLPLADRLRRSAGGAARPSRIVLGCGARRRRRRALGRPQPDGRRSRDLPRGFALARREKPIPVPAAAAGIAFIAAAIARHPFARRPPDRQQLRRGGQLRSPHPARRTCSPCSGLRTAAANLVGQTWYLLVATFGLAAARRRGFPPPAEGASRAFCSLFTAGLLLVSAAAFPERTRPDMLIYGRYVEVAAPALIALGLAALAAGRLPRWTKGPAIGFAACSPPPSS